MRKIQWLKWEDPLKPNEKLEVDDSQYQEQKDSFEEEEETTKHVRLISGPYGLIPIAEHGISSGLYKLWVGHTNFDITAKIISDIENIKGVEILKVWTRYRFWLGIGNLFDVEKVQIEIENKICNGHKNTKSKIIKKLCSIMKSKNKSWAVCSNKNGHLETVVGLTDFEVKTEILNNDFYVIRSNWTV